MMCNLCDIGPIDYLVLIQSLPCLNKVIWFSRRAPIDIQCAERYTELSHIFAQGP